MHVIDIPPGKLSPDRLASPARGDNLGGDKLAGPGLSDSFPAKNWAGPEKAKNQDLAWVLRHCAEIRSKIGVYRCLCTLQNFQTIN